MTTGKGSVNTLIRRKPDRIIVKLFIRFRPLCLRYLQPTPPPAQIRDFWRHFQSSDNQLFEELEKAQTGLQKGHSCDATVALSTLKCGSFANSESLNEKTDGLLRCYEADFSFWLESFGGCIFVDIIRYNPAPCRDILHRFFIGGWPIRTPTFTVPKKRPVPLCGDRPLNM